MVFQREILVEVAPRGWLVLAAVVLGGALFLALLVLLLVSGADFNSPANNPPIPKGSCYPFCTASPEPPPPGF
ncbi:hypothetical protein [Nocardia sp. alder85J]|uniref:hypothetical protein n=1 Tax=Nocardia sp. alder85J TaxID=2862949 RepID=UPI001CD7D530|nr:hypothetical protein [Nocardia sp. alder85J]MCX4096037.1 hypothetical protein [Nocardia sp. alder85J]